MLYVENYISYNGDSYKIETSAHKQAARKETISKCQMLDLLKNSNSFITVDLGVGAKSLCIAADIFNISTSKLANYMPSTNLTAVENSTIYLKSIYKWDEYNNSWHFLGNAEHVIKKLTLDYLAYEEGSEPLKATKKYIFNYASKNYYNNNALIKACLESYRKYSISGYTEYCREPSVEYAF
ncbi:MAG: hypothetical protein GX660_24335 [Clostridiaceae bacterium]|nr:hypothetical protein [Clostridiaceae bacterium]